MKMKKKRKSEEEEEAAPELTGLPSTATMMSPRTMLPAKPLVVGRSPAFAARLPPGTFGGEAEEQSQAVSPARGRRRRRRRRGGGGGAAGRARTCSTSAPFRTLSWLATRSGAISAFSPARTTCDAERTPQKKKASRNRPATKRTTGG